MATFIAMLELTRLKRLHISQDVQFGEIYCEKISEERRLAEESNEKENLKNWEWEGESGEISGSEPDAGSNEIHSNAEKTESGNAYHSGAKQ